MLANRPLIRPARTLVGNPINQALLQKTGPRISVAFQGALLAVALVATLWVRWLYLGRRWQWRVHV